MATGKSSWKYNKLLTPRKKYFFGGGPLVVGPPPVSYDIPGIRQPNNNGYTESITSTKSDTNTSKKPLSINMGALQGYIPLGNNAIMDIASMASDITAPGVKERQKEFNARINAAQMSGLDNSGVDEVLARYKSYTPLGYVTGDQLGKVGAGQATLKAGLSAAKGAMAGISTGNPIAMGVGAGIGLLTSGIGSIIKNSKVNKAERELKEAVNRTNAYNEDLMSYEATKAAQSQINRSQANYSAYGGPLGLFDGAIGYDFMNDYLTSRRLQAEGQKDRLQALPTMAGIDKFALGGNLMTHGADWSTGLNYIANGGSHESNPYEGVPIGVDQEGVPNLVEQGETIWNDYVFSRRLMVPKAFRKKYKLGGKLSFADASLKLAKESEERPNDPISQRGLEALMSELAMAQEEIKAKKEENEFAYGGKVNKFVFGGFPEAPEFDPHTDAKLDFNKLFAGDSPYIGRLNYIRDNWDLLKENGFLADFTEFANGLFTGKEGVSPIVADNLTYDQFRRMAMTGDSKDYDSKRYLYALLYTNPYEYQLDTNPYDEVPASDESIPDASTTVSTTTNTQSASTNAATKATQQTKTGTDASVGRNNYYGKIDGEDVLLGDDYARMIRKNNWKQVMAIPQVNNPNFYDYYYDVEPEVEKLKEHSWVEKLSGISALNNIIQLGANLISGPDYSIANSALDAVREAGKFVPVTSHPIGNFVGTDPLDTDKAINDLNALSGSTKRTLLNTAAGNIGTAAANVLASDKTLTEGIGEIYRQAKEYNRDDLFKSAEFNKDTAKYNSDDLRSTMMANASGMADAAKSTISGLLTGYGLMRDAKRDWDTGNTTNLNSLFETAENKATEAKHEFMLRWLLNQGWRPGAQSYRAAEGGKLKRVKRTGYTTF